MKRFLTSPIPGIVLGALVLLLALGVMRLDVRPLTFHTADLLVDNTAQVNGTFTAANGDVTIGGTGQVKVTGGNGVQINTVSGVLTLPRVLSFNGDPNGTVTAVAGSVLMDTSTPAIWQNTDGATAWTALASASTVTAAINGINYGWFGDASDGSPTFDGSTTVLGMVPSSNTYTMTRDIHLQSPSCSSGVTIKTAGFRIFVKTDFAGPGSGTCTIWDQGGAAVTNTAGTDRANCYAGGGPALLASGANGGAGKTINSGGDAGASTISASCSPMLAGNGGAGGGNPGVANGGAGGVTTCASFAALNGTISNITEALNGFLTSGTCIRGGSGGGGGGRDGTGSGISGGGGAGGGYVVFASKHVTNPTHVTLTAAGGNGAAASSCSGGNSSGGGGGGGGGYVVLVLAYGSEPTIDVAGGSPGAGCGPLGTAGISGSSGKSVILMN